MQKSRMDTNVCRGLSIFPNIIPSAKTFSQLRYLLKVPEMKTRRNFPAPHVSVTLRPTPDEHEFPRARPQEKAHRVTIIFTRS